MIVVLNTIVSAVVIGLAAWLSRRYPVTTGFFVALPLSTMLVLPLAYLQHKDAESTFILAKSILVALPLTLLFFVPFLLRARLGLSFWSAYAIGCALLPLGYVVHRSVAQLLR